MIKSCLSISCKKTSNRKFQNYIFIVLIGKHHFTCYHKYNIHHKYRLYIKEKYNNDSNFIVLNVCLKLAQPVSIFLKLFINTRLLGCGQLLWIDILSATFWFPIWGSSLGHQKAAECEKTVAADLCQTCLLYTSLSWLPWYVGSYYYFESPIL